jgi:hypothetical protein
MHDKHGPECGNTVGESIGCPAMNKRNHRHWLLPARCDRPSGCAAAKQKEFAPSYA